METDALLMRLTALSDRSRLAILRLMAKGAIGTCCDRIEAYENGCCVADVVAATGLSQPTVSHHLKALEHAGLVRKELRGPWTCYFPNPAALDEVVQSLQTELYPMNPNGGCCDACAQTPCGD